MRALIIGCGYLGLRVAQSWVEADHEVSALTRSTENAGTLRDADIQPIVGDVLDRDSLKELPAADTLLYAVGYDRSSSQSKNDVYVNGLKNVLDVMAGRVGRVIYVSSVSVYGQTDGSWVDEDSPCNPSTDSGQICLEAERALQTRVADGKMPADTTILRLAGIYGPGRLIGRLDRLRSGEPVGGRPDAWLNLIHVVDAARCVVACGNGQATRPLYLIADDKPVLRGEFYAELARHVGAPEPSFDPHSPTGQRSSGLGKRCLNSRMHGDLVDELICPDFSTGLASSVQS